MLGFMSVFCFTVSDVLGFMSLFKDVAKEKTHMCFSRICSRMLSDKFFKDMFKDVFHIINQY